MSDHPIVVRPGEGRRNIHAARFDRRIGLED
jgi:hypothetical protein